MTTPTATRRRYISGHCHSAHHANCRGAYGGIACACSCHRPCETCGQPWPQGVPRA